jgi:hypothetical protein
MSNILNEVPPFSKNGKIKNAISASIKAPQRYVAKVSDTTMMTIAKMPVQKLSIQ